MCRLYGFIGGLTGTASIATLTAISIDRYNVGKKKIREKKFFSFKIVELRDRKLYLYVCISDEILRFRIALKI